MVRGKKAKTAALVIAAACITASLAGTLAPFDLKAVGISAGCTVQARMAYPFFHASIMHALINCWCLLSIVFVYNVSVTALITAYVIAAAYPVETICSVFPGMTDTGAHTVGLSAVCFALMGQVSFQTGRRVLFHSWILAFVAMGFLLPPLCAHLGIPIAASDNVLHIYCYVSGLTVGFLNSTTHG